VLKQKKIAIAALIVALVLTSIFVASNLLAPGEQARGSATPVYFGIEIGWNSTLGDCKALIDKVDNYTNLLIIASPTIIANETALDQICEYAYNAGMYFMPTYYQSLNNATSLGYYPDAWLTSAKERYGNHLLGVYYYDEPGGSQLDQNKLISGYHVTSPPASYLDYANYYFWLWNHGSGGVAATTDFIRSKGLWSFTSDYGLYWFDYQLGYDTVLAEFGWNNSRQLQISLIRGAKEAQNKTWGAIITWTYTQSPYLESDTKMYEDLVLAYDSGACYIVVYDSSHNYANSTLTPAHYDALKDFWSYMQRNSDKHYGLRADTAVVLPQNYAFGFRSQNDSVWQYRPADSWTQVMYADITNLSNKINLSLDIVYSDYQFQKTISNHYSKVLLWPEDFTTNISYPVVNINNNLGYNTIQEAISSFATYQEDTVLAKSGTYQEKVAVTKPVTLISSNNGTAIIDGTNKDTALTIASDNVTVMGFSVENGGSFLGKTGSGILLNNSRNCTLANNTVTNSYSGIFINNSSNNTIENNTVEDNFNGILFDDSSGNILKNNNLNKNTNSIVLQNSSLNIIDSSNIVDGEPYTPK
jgi:parallel beta-helix repeat protein